MAFLMHAIKFYGSRASVERDGYQPIDTSAELLVFINRYGGGLSVPGTVVECCIGFDSGNTYLLVDMKDGTKVYYRKEIGQRVKKRMKLWQQSSTGG